MNTKTFAAVVAILVSCVACSRHGGTESATNSVPDTPRAAVSRRPAARIDPSAPRKTFVSFSGRYTNLVYDTMGRAGGLYEEDIEELERLCSAEPDNADVWYAMGVRRHGDAVKQVECFEKAIALAPDALMPRLALANALTHQMRKPGEARIVLADAYPLLKKPEEFRSWCWTVVSLHHMDKKEAAALDALVKEHADSSPGAAFACAMMAQQLGRQADAVGLYGQVLAGTGSNEFRDMVLAQLRQMTGRNGTNEAAASLVGLHATPFEKAMMAIERLDEDGVRTKGVELVLDAMDKATNADMRLMACMRLMWSEQFRASAASNIEMLATQAIGTDGWRSPHVSTVAGGLWRAGATNTLRRLLEESYARTDNDPTFAIAVLSGMRYGGYGGYEFEGRRGYMGDVMATDVDIASGIQSRFSSNAAVLRALADIYAVSGRGDDEVACRRTIVALEPPGRKRLAQAASLLHAMVKQGDIDGAKALAADLQPAASSNAALARALGTYLCAAGRTNDACTLLISCCAAMQSRESKIEVLQAMLQMRWTDQAVKQRVADAAKATLAPWPPAPQDYMANNARGMVVKLLSDAGRDDEAFALVAAAIRAGCQVDGAFELVRKKKNRSLIEQLAGELLGSAQTQAMVFASMADICQQADLSVQALALNLCALRHDSQAHTFVYRAGTTITLARELDDDKALREVIALVEARVRDGRCSVGMLQNIDYTFDQTGLRDALDSLYNQAWFACTNKTDYNVMQAMARWYTRRGNTNGVRDLLAQMTALPEEAGSERAGQLMQMYRYVGDREGCRRVIDALKLSLTNAQAIAAHGQEYLRLCQEFAGRNGSEILSGDARALMLEWMGDRALPFHFRQSLCSSLYREPELRTKWLESLLAEAPERYQKGQIQNDLMNAYVESGNTAGFLRIAETMRNEPQGQSWMMHSVMNYYERLGMLADAVVLCEQLAMQQEGSPREQAQLLAQAARLYLRMDNKEQALQTIEDALMVCPQDQNRQYLVQQAAELYRETGQAQKGLDLLLDLFGKADDANMMRNMGRQIANYVRNAEIEFDPSTLVARMLEVDRSVDGLCVAADMLSDNGDSAAAKNYLEQALAAAETRNEKMQVCERMVRAADASGSTEEKLAVLEMMLPLADRQNRQYVFQRIAQTLMEDGQYQAAAEKIATFMDDPASKSLDKYYADSLRQTMADAFVRSGDTQAAWKAAKDIDDISQFVHIAQRLGYEGEMVARLEQEVESGDFSRRLNAARMLADILGRTKDTDAIGRVADAITASAKDASPSEMVTIAGILQQAGRDDAALDLLKQAGKDAPESQQNDIDQHIVALLRKVGKIDDAIAWLDARPRSSTTLALKAQMRAAQGKAEDAAALYCDAMASVDRNNAWRRNNYSYELMNLLAKPENAEWAEKMIGRMLDTAGNDPDLRARAATMYMNRKEYDKALDQYKTAASLAKEEYQKRNYLQQYAQCCITAKKFDEAIDTYAGMIKDDKLQWAERDSLQMNLGTVYRQSGRESMAFDMCKERIKSCEAYIAKRKRKDETVYARFKLADLHHEANDDNEAVKVLQKIADDYKKGPNAERAARELKKYGR